MTQPELSEAERVVLTLFRMEGRPEVCKCELAQTLFTIEPGQPFEPVFHRWFRGGLFTFGEVDPRWDDDHHRAVRLDYDLIARQIPERPQLGIQP